MRERRSGWIVAGLLLLVGGCSTAGGHRVEDPPNNRLGGLSAVDVQRRTCFTQAQEVLQVWESRDFEGMVARTHPFAVERLGGPQKAVETIRKIVTDWEAEEIFARAFGLVEPTKIVPSAGRLYAVLPYELEMKKSGQPMGGMTTFLIGESRDGGKSWVFLDGNGAKRDPELLHQALPDFPESLKLPAVEQRQAKDSTLAP